MKKYFTLLLGILLTSFMPGCRTYFGYNTRKQVTTKLDFLKEHSDTKQKWKEYAECYAQPIEKETRDKLLKKAEKLYEEKYGSFYSPHNKHTKKQYEEKIREFFEEAAHPYRLVRGTATGKIPSHFRVIYPSYQSFQTAMKTWERKYLAVENEFKRANLPRAVRISSVAQNYFYKDGFIYGNYIEKLKEPQLDVEARSHIYSDNAFWFPPFIFLRYPFDFLACFFGKWELAEHKPDFFTLISYCPPFSWFFTRTPPYFTEPSPWKTEYQVIISEKGSTVVERKRTQEVPKKEIPQAIGWLQKKSAGGDATAQFALAMIFKEGKYVPKDERKALNFYKLAAQSGNSSAEKYVIALLSASELEASSRQITDRRQKARYLKAAADKGSSSAQFSYAVLCGYDNNVTEELAYLKKSAEQGNVRAIELLFQRFAGNKDLGKYADALKKANSPSGLCAYAKWCFLSAKRQEALKYFKISARRGNPDAQYHLASILGYGRLSAAEKGKKEMDGGTAFALLLVPTLVSGEYTLADFQESFVWMKKAAEGGHPDAQKMLPDIESNAKRYLAAVRARQMAEMEFANPQNSNKLLEVKNAVFTLDRSRTLEEAFASQMDNLKWRYFTNNLGQKVVEVVGKWKNDRYNPGKDVGMLRDVKMKFPQKGDEVMAQFVIRYSRYSPVEFDYGEVRDSRGVCKTYISGQYSTVSEKGNYIRINTKEGGMKKEIFFAALYGIDQYTAELENTMEQYKQSLKMLGR